MEFTEENKTIKCIELTGYGGYDKIQIRNKPYPVGPNEKEVVVKVKACGINFADIYTRQGLIRERNPPFILGLECAGLVVDVGSHVVEFQKGDRVLVHTGDHGLEAEVVCVNSCFCYKIPDSMSFDDAAALPINYLTAYFSIIDIGHLQANQTVLIPSAAGGVGWAATQLAKSIPNVRVIGLASPNKHDEIRSNGVDIAIDSHDPKWDEAVKTACPEGVDVAYDITSGGNFIRTQQLLKHLGRAILIGGNDMIGDEQMNWWRVFRCWWHTYNIRPVDLVLNSRTVAGFHLTHARKLMPERYNQALQLLFQMYQKKQIKPRIDSIWPFKQVSSATKRLANRENVGKVLLHPAEDEE